MFAECAAVGAIAGGMLVLFIIFMPKGILGAALEASYRRRSRVAAASRAYMS